MATSTEFSSLSLSTSHDRIQLCSKSLQILFVLSILWGIVATADAQTPPQQYVYGSQPLTSTSSVVTGFSKASQTGALSALPGSPFNERLEGGLIAIDGQGKFLFVLNPKSNDISMFQINQASGALSEVPASPFKVPPTINPNLAPSQPISIATEKSGKFLFVGYYLGDIQGLSAVVSLAIDTSGPNPVLLTKHSIQTNSGGAPAQLLTDPKGLRLYVGLSRGQNNLQVGGAEVYSIDTASGALGFLGIADSPPAEGRSVALDPRGRFFFVGWGANIGALDSCILSPVDGTAPVPSSSVQLGVGNFPNNLVAENSGKFLYVAQVGGTVVYSIDQTTGTLTQVLGPLTNISLGPGTAVADSMGPYIYSVFSAVGIHVYQVDQLSGNLTEIPGWPFTAGMSGVVGASGIAISGNPVQAVSGPAATIFPSTANFGAITVGGTSSTKLFSIVNIGDQTLSISSISITGPNASSFSQSNTCASTLAPNANCTVSINFTPASTGALTGVLQVADNAPGSPQALTLSGTGVATTTAVTFSPAAPPFPPLTQRTPGRVPTLTAITPGTRPYPLPLAAPARPNLSDFSFTNNCTAPRASAASFTISLRFHPTWSGQRTAKFLI